MEAPLRAFALPLLLALSAWLLSADVARAELDTRGEIGFEGRAFWPDDEPTTKDWGAALLSRLELRHKHGTFRERLRLLGRVGGVDQSRSQLIVEEAYVGWKPASWLSLRLGPQLLNWTATEAFHPADVMNSRNLDSNVENAEKIGEPMLKVSARVGNGRLEFFYLPFRMSPLLPEASQRLSFAPAGTRLGDPLWMGRDGAASDDLVEHQWGARVSQTFGDADIALQVVQHNDRSQPTIVFDAAKNQARPLYHLVTHFGLTYTHVIDAVLLKVEAAHRRFDAPEDLGRFIPLGASGQRDHTQVALGLEIGWEHENSQESTWILEGQGVFAGSDAARFELSPFQADVLVGYRWALNDIDGKELLVSVIFDVERSEILGNLTYSQRLSDTWTLVAAARFTHAPADGAGLQPTGLQALHKSHHLQLTLTRHF